jgi:hypothetical protein
METRDMSMIGELDESSDHCDLAIRKSKDAESTSSHIGMHWIVPNHREPAPIRVHGMAVSDGHHRVSKSRTKFKEDGN